MDSLIQKRHVLRCIQHLVQALGADMSAFAPKLLNLLKCCLEDPCLEIRRHSCQIMLYFVESVDYNTLTAHLSRIVVDLLADFSSLEPDIVRILEHVVMTRGDEMRPAFDRIPMLPMSPSLQHINDKVLFSLRGPCCVKMSFLTMHADQASRWSADCPRPTLQFALAYSARKCQCPHALTHPRLGSSSLRCIHVAKSVLHGW